MYPNSRDQSHPLEENQALALVCALCARRYVWELRPYPWLWCRFRLFILVEGRYVLRAVRGPARSTTKGHLGAPPRTECKYCCRDHSYRRILVHLVSNCWCAFLPTALNSFISKPTVRCSLATRISLSLSPSHLYLYHLSVYLYLYRVQNLKAEKH